MDADDPWHCVILHHLHVFHTIISLYVSLYCHPLTSCLLSLIFITDRCLVAGLFTSVSELQLDGRYLTMAAKQEATIHPSSVLFGGKPAYVLFTELVHTGQTYMHINAPVDAQWLYDVAPEYFRKRHIKINP